MNINTLNEKAQLKLGEKLAKASHHKGCIIFLQGDLGAGKTTLVRGFLKGLGYLGKVKSPTYTLVETYQLSLQTIYHVDLYRISHPSEVEELGLFDATSDIAIFLIEWPEKAASELPKPDMTCSISFFKKGRVCQLMAHSVRGKEIMTVMDS